VESLKVKEYNRSFVVKDWRGRLFEKRALVGGVFLSGILFLAKPNVLTYVLGMALGFFGLIIRLWAAGFIGNHRVYSLQAPELTVSGPYSIVRNPLYCGNFFIGLGVVTAGNRLFGYVWFFLLFFLLYFPIISYEEDFLLKRFKGEYLKYKNRVPRLFPSFYHYNPEPDGFSWFLAFKEELPTILLYLLILTVLFFKTV
jgi:protein-S-isoprenylcysteine O-methyltransferase Ste14